MESWAKKVEGAFGHLGADSDTFLGTDGNSAQDLDDTLHKYNTNGHLQARGGQLRASKYRLNSDAKDSQSSTG